MLIRLRAEFPEPPALDALELKLHRALGGKLHVEIERRVDPQSLLVELSSKLCVELLPDPLDEIRRGIARLCLVCELKRKRLGPACFDIADRSVSAHQLDDSIAALNRAVWMLARVVPLGCFRQSSKRRGLRDVQIANRFSEIALGCGFDAKSTVSE